MTRIAIAALLFVGSAVLFVGCDSPTYPATDGGGSSRPAPEKRRDVDVKIRTPGADVDVERRGTGKTKVDVRTKDDDK